MKQRGLGKGLDALFAIYDKEEPATKIESTQPIKQEEAQKELTQDNTGVNEIKIDLIDPDKNQPRKSFDENSMKELANSIKLHGVIQPIVVTERDGRYTIIAGERRWRGSKLAGLKTIPAIIRNYTTSQIREISIVENLQREDLNPIESAKAIKQLMEEYNWTQETVADRLGKSRPVIANTVRLLNLEPEVIKLIEDGKLSAGHARSLVVVTNREAQIKLAKQVSEKKLTVRDLEKATKNKSATKTFSSNQSEELKELIRDMQRAFSTKVSLIGNDHRGRIYIDYYSKDDLDRIYDITHSIK